MKMFGLIAYECCESLDKKFDMLRQIPYLRRICVGPRAKGKGNTDQIGRDYILSWRPVSTMVNAGYELGHNRAIIRKGLEMPVTVQQKLF